MLLCLLIVKKGLPVVVFGGQMIRSRLLHHARRLSTSPSTNSHSRLRLSTLAFITTTGVLVSSYFLWPSKYRGSPTFSHRPLSPSYFIPVTISENSQVGPDLALLTLSVPPDSRRSDENDPSLDPIWSIFIKDDDIQVERPYTPLFGIDEGVIKLWVKRYPRGEVGRWLHSKQAGDTIEIRGPLKTFPFREGEWDEIVMVYLPLRRAFTFLIFLYRRYLEEQVSRRSTSYYFAVFFKARSHQVLALRFFTHPGVQRSSHRCPYYNLWSTAQLPIPNTFN
jgi:cytochrome-b5 reductase